MNPDSRDSLPEHQTTPITTKTTALSSCESFSDSETGNFLTPQSSARTSDLGVRIHSVPNSRSRQGAQGQSSSSTSSSVGNEIAVFWRSCYSDDVGRRDMWRELKKGELTHAKRQSRSRTTLVTVGDSSNAPEPVRCGPRSLESRRSCRPLTRIRLAGRPPAKKRTLNRSSRLREERPGSRSCSAWLATLSELRNQASLPSPAAASFLRSARPLGFCRQPTFRNPLCWLNVGHQMIADQHDRALEVIFSRIRENKEILGNLKIEGTTAR
jgi:hypothetical protein